MELVSYCVIWTMPETTQTRTLCVLPGPDQDLCRFRQVKHRKYNRI